MRDMETTKTGPFTVYLKGREVEVARFRFLVLAEEEARRVATETGRQAYVIDESKSIYDSPVYRTP